MSSIGSVHHVRLFLRPLRFAGWVALQMDGTWWNQLLNKPSHFGWWFPWFLSWGSSHFIDDWSARPQVLAIHLGSQNHRLPKCTFPSYVWLGWEYQVWYLDAPKGSIRWKHWKPKGGVPVRVARFEAHMRLQLYWKWLMHITLWILSENGNNWQISCLIILLLMYHLVI